MAQIKFAGEREDDDDVYDYIGETRNSSRPSSARRYLPCRGDAERNRESMVCIRIPCQKYRDATQTNRKDKGKAGGDGREGGFY